MDLGLLWFPPFDWFQRPMALKARTSRALSGWIRSFQYIFYGLGAIISFAIAHDADAARSNAPLWIKDTISFVHKTCGSWFWVCAALAALTTFSRNFVGPKEVWSAVHTLLNDFRDRAFETQEDPYANRVTLFRHSQWCFKRTAWFKMFTQGKWIWGGWLVPVERSGDMAQSPSVAFYAPLDHPNRAEGFAGIVFRRRVTFERPELPDLNRRMLDSAAGEKTLKVYCELTNVTPSEIKERLKRDRMCARSFWGLHLEKEDTSLWGVLVIDSQQPKIKPKEEIYGAYKSLAKVLDAMLKEI
jgi:hypothetical protein